MDDDREQSKLSNLRISLLLVSSLFILALLIPVAFATTNFMDALWTTGSDAENLSLNQGETAELYVHIPFVPSGNSFTFAVSAENGEGSRYLISPSTKTAPYSRNIPLDTASLAGKYEVIIQAVNAGGTDVKTLQLNVNTAPRISVPANSIVVEDGQLVSFIITGTDVDKDNLTLVASSALPSGATLTGVSRTAGNIEKRFLWTPRYNQVGTRTLRFRVADEDGLIALGTVTVIVNPHNVAPVITSFDDGASHTVSDTPSIQENEILQMRPLATDADGDVLQYTIEAEQCVPVLPRIPPICFFTTLLPGEMTFNSMTGLLRFTPGYDFVHHSTQQLRVNARFRVSDGEFSSAWKNVVITVHDVNQQPVADTLTMTLQEDHAITFVLPAHDNDAEDDLTYELGGSMPAHGDLSSFDSVRGRITYTPYANYFGLDSFTFVAEDNTGSSSARSGQGTITLEISGINDAPLLNIPNVTLGEDFSPQIFNLHTYTTDNDTPSPALSYTLVSQSNPSLMSCTLNTANPFRLECISQPNKNGTNTLTISVNDGGSIVSDSFTITVNPLNDPITITGQVPLSTPEDTPLTLTLADLIVDDPDNEYPSGFSLNVASGTNYTVSGTTITPATNFNGTLYVPATVLQGGTVRGNITLTITVTPVNDAPVAGNDTVTVTEDTPLQINVLRNDSDVDSVLNIGSVRIARSPAYGTVAVNADGTITYAPALNSINSDSFTYTMSDAEGLISNEATVTLTINSENDVPQLTLRDQIVYEDSGTHSYNLRDFATDIEDMPEELSFFISGQSDSGDIITCALAADGFTLVCTTQQNQNGESIVDIRVTDSQSAFRFFPVKFTVQPVNDAPLLNIPNVTLGEDFSPQIFNLHTYTTDNDTPSPALSYTLVSQSNPSLMSCTLNPANPFRLECTSRPNKNGTNTLTISVNDGGSIVSDSFTITVNPLNDPITITGQVPLSTPEDTPLTLTLAHLIVDDPDNEYPSSFSLSVASGANYTVSGTTITPATNFNGTLSVPATVLQGGTVRGNITLTITVTPVNDAPVATDDAVAVPEDTAKIIAVLANDHDIDSALNPAKVRVVTAPQHGDAVENADGTITYTPDANSTTTDSFTYTVEDVEGLISNEARAMITLSSVNDAPVAENFSITLDEDTSLHFNLRGSDVDSAFIFVLLTGALPAHGTLLDFNQVTGDLTYTPQKNYFGPDEFTYMVDDGTATSALAIVNITVNPINDIPVAQNDSTTTPEETPVRISVLINDSDADGSSDLLTVTHVSDPGFGTAIIEGNEIVYTPNENIFGITDQFTYTMRDSHGEEAQATVRVEITALDNDLPRITGQKILSTPEDTALTLQLSNIEVTDPDNEYPTNFFLQILDGEHYTHTGTIVTPELNYDGTLQVPVQVTDGEEYSNVFMLEIEVIPVNDAPVITGQRILSMSEDASLAITFADITVEDPDNEYSHDFTLTFEEGDNYTLLNDHTVVPVSNFLGELHVPVKVNDGTLNSNQFSLLITVTPVNDAPLFTSTPLTAVEEDVRYQYHVTASDAENNLLTFSALTLPSWLTFDAVTGELGGTPTNSQTGAHQVTLQVSDGSLTAEQSFTIAVVPINDAPILAPIGNKTIAENQLLQFLITATDVDSSAAVLNFLAEGIGNLFGATFVNNTFSWVPGFDQAGDHQVNFKVTDDFGASDNETITIHVANSPQIPVAHAQTLSTAEDTPLYLALTGTDTDGEIVAYHIVNTPAHGSLTGTAPNLIYTPAADFNGTDSFTFTVRDNDGQLSAPAQITLTVMGVNDAPIITSSPVITALVDEPYVYQLMVHDDSPVNYSLVEAPTGMSISSSGLISWTPRTPGNYTVVLKVSDSQFTVEQRFIITVQNAREDLQIMWVQMSSEEIHPGEALEIAVMAQNKGKKTEKQLEVQLAIPELGIQQSTSLGTLKAGQSKQVKQTLVLPQDLSENEDSYLLMITVQNDTHGETEYRYLYKVPDAVLQRES